MISLCTPTLMLAGPAHFIIPIPKNSTLTNLEPRNKYTRHLLPIILNAQMTHTVRLFRSANIAKHPHEFTQSKYRNRFGFLSIRNWHTFNSEWFLFKNGRYASFIPFFKISKTSKVSTVSRDRHLQSAYSHFWSSFSPSPAPSSSSASSSSNQCHHKSLICIKFIIFLDMICILLLNFSILEFATLNHTHFSFIIIKSLVV